VLNYSLYFYLIRVTSPFKFIIFYISFISCIQIVIFVSFDPILILIYIQVPPLNTPTSPLFWFICPCIAYWFHGISEEFYQIK
jgi:hypothetical protein